MQIVPIRGISSEGFGVSTGPYTYSSSGAVGTAVVTDAIDSSVATHIFEYKTETTGAWTMRVLDQEGTGTFVQR